MGATTLKSLITLLAVLAVLGTNSTQRDTVAEHSKEHRKESSLASSVEEAAATMKGTPPVHDKKPGFLAMEAKNGRSGFQARGSNSFKVASITIANKCSKEVKIWGQTLKEIQGCQRGDGKHCFDARVIASGATKKFTAADPEQFVPALDERFDLSFVTTLGSNHQPGDPDGVVYEMNPMEFKIGAAPGDWQGKETQQLYTWPKTIHSSFVTQFGYSDLNLDIAFWKNDDFKSLVCSDSNPVSAKFSRARTQFDTSACPTQKDHAKLTTDAGTYPHFQVQPMCLPLCTSNGNHNKGKVIDPQPFQGDGVTPNKNFCGEQGMSEVCVISAAQWSGDPRAPPRPGAVTQKPDHNEFAKYATDNTLQCKGNVWTRTPPSAGHGWRIDNDGAIDKWSSPIFECWDKGGTGNEGMNFCDFPDETHITITTCSDFVKDGDSCGTLS